METKNTNITTTKDEKIAALVGSLIFFAPCFMKTKTEFVTFYMKQSFGLSIIYFVISIVFGILTHFLSFFIYISMILGLLIFIAIVFIAVKAYKGERFEIPHLYKCTDRLVSKISFLKKLFASR